MKAAVIFPNTKVPQWVDSFPDPVSQEENEVLIDVKAAAIKHLDRSVAGGTHYSSQGDISQAKVIGGDGVGVLADGTRVFALGISGMVAEKAIVDKRRMVAVPAQLDDATAAALPNAVAGSAMALRFRANIKKGDTVLINGATGFTGRIAVQVAKYYGAGKVIATGRNEPSLASLAALGADMLVLTHDDTNFIKQVKEIHLHSPIDIILDYLWGHTAELLLSALKGQGSFTPRTRFVSIGSLAGDKIQLSAEVLRSVDLHLSGSGLGSWTKAEMQLLFSEIIPEMLQLAAEDKLRAGITTIGLSEIEKAWEVEISDGYRLVVMI